MPFNIHGEFDVKKDIVQLLLQAYDYLKNENKLHYLDPIFGVVIDMPREWYDALMHKLEQETGVFHMVSRSNRYTNDLCGFNKVKENLSIKIPVMRKIVEYYDYETPPDYGWYTKANE